MKTFTLTLYYEHFQKTYTLSEEAAETLIDLVKKRDLSSIWFTDVYGKFARAQMPPVLDLVEKKPNESDIIRRNLGLKA